jgi:RNA-directed DNA polymerase
LNKDCLNLKSLSDIASACSTTTSRLSEILLDPARYYTRFPLPKRGGGFREIRPPTGDLKVIQSELKRFIQARTRWTNAVHGGIKGRNIFSNAQPHVGKDMVSTIDLANFYPSTSSEIVCSALVRCGCSALAAEKITALTMLDNGLPQGSPTSMILGNLALEKLDSKFMELQHGHSLDYSRYVDDLSLSGNKNLKDFRSTMIGIVEKEGFSVATKKIFFRGRNEPQIVTSLFVNDIIRPSTEFLSDLRWTIRQCWPDNKGVAKVALGEELTVGELRAQLWGRIQFVKQIHPKLGQQVRAMMVRVDWNTEEVHGGSQINIITARN